jgi:cobalt-zinc-cadmium efflux system membrane fusion protein
LANAPQLFAPLFVLTNPATLWVLLDVPEADLALVRVGTPVTIRAQAWPTRQFRGQITVVAGALDATTRTLKVRAVVDNSERLLKAEMLVSARVTRPTSSTVAVPENAILLDGDSHIVFVEESRGRYLRRRVNVGAEHGGLVPVDGVRIGERVVTGSTLLLEQLYRSVAHS